MVSTVDLLSPDVRTHIYRAAINIGATLRLHCADLLQGLSGKQQFLALFYNFWHCQHPVLQAAPPQFTYMGRWSHVGLMHWLDSWSSSWDSVAAWDGQAATKLRFVFTAAARTLDPTSVFCAPCTQTIPPSQKNPLLLATLAVNVCIAGSPIGALCSFHWQPLRPARSE